MTAQERHTVQDWVARRYLQIRFPLVGRRWYDRKKVFAGNLNRYIQWQIEREPWRRRRGR
jgi:hypothetical protein